MAYNILGVNPFHNGSACVLSDGEIVYYLEEERLSKRKYDANPFRVILDILDRFKIDLVMVAGINLNDKYLGYDDECPFSSLIRKFHPQMEVRKVSDYHHDCHLAQTYYNSGFLNSLGVVIDSGGSFIKNKGMELDSLYICSSTDTIKNIIKNYIKYNLPTESQTPQSLNIAASYTIISEYLGFNKNEEGKTMGLSSYGKYNPLFPNFFKGNNSDNNILYEVLNSNGGKEGTFITSQFQLPSKKKDFLNYSSLEKDLAWHIQNDTQQIVGDYIEKYTKETGVKQVCCSGGYFLNCVANYYLTKRFPDIEFYFEPLSHDGGTAIGAAKLAWQSETKDTTIRPQKTLYYGPQYSKEQLLEGIKKYT